MWKGLRKETELRAAGRGSRVPEFSKFINVRLYYMFVNFLQLVGFLLITSLALLTLREACVCVRACARRAWCT